MKTEEQAKTALTERNMRFHRPKPDPRHSMPCLRGNRTGDTEEHKRCGLRLCQCGCHQPKARVKKTEYA